MSAETDIAALEDAGANTAAEVRTALTSVLARADALPGWLSSFLGTSDADHTYWNGTDLADDFTVVTVSGTQTPTEADNLLSVAAGDRMTADDFNAALRPVTFAIGDVWQIPVRMLALEAANGISGCGICFTDGAVATSNVVIGHLQQGATPILVGRHGTLTAPTTSPWVSDAAPSRFGSFFFWIRLTYQAANSFRLAFSPDGISFTTFDEADIAKIMTPTHVGVCWSATSDDWKSVFTFGPLRKVA